MKQVDIFSDGSCTYTDKGRGGYGAVLIFKGVEKEIYGGYTRSTNNRMELLAVIKALECLSEPCEVNVYSDSTYVVNPLKKKWLIGWIAKGFRGVKNPDLWKRLITLLAKHKVTFNWVKGHAGIRYNERADVLATIGANLPELIVDIIPIVD